MPEAAGTEWEDADLDALEKATEGAAEFVAREDSGAEADTTELSAGAPEEGTEAGAALQ